MWWTPGIFLGGLIVVITMTITGRADHWWMWLVCVLVAGTIDGWLGLKRTQRPKIRKETVYKSRIL